MLAQTVPKAETKKLNEVTPDNSDHSEEEGKEASADVAGPAKLPTATAPALEERFKISKVEEEEEYDEEDESGSTDMNTRRKRSSVKKKASPYVGKQVPRGELEAINEADEEKLTNVVSPSVGPSQASVEGDSRKGSVH